MTNKASVFIKCSFLAGNTTCWPTMLIFVLLTFLTGCGIWEQFERTEIPVTPQPTDLFPLHQQWMLLLESEILGLTAKEDILVVATDNNLLALDAVQATILWRIEFSNVDDHYYSQVTLLIDNDSVYVANIHGLFCINIVNGQTIWELKEEQSKRILAFSEEYIFLELTNRETRAIHKTTGEETWYISQGRTGGIDIFVDAQTDQIIYAVYQKGNESFDQLYVYIDDGIALWNVPLGIVKQSIYVDGVLFYVPVLNNGKLWPLIAMDVQTRTENWSVPVTADRDSVQHLYAHNDAVYILTNTRIAKLDNENGKILWETVLGDNIYRPPVLMDNVIYLRCQFFDRIIALDTVNGSYLGELHIESDRKGSVGLHDDFLATTKIAQENLLIFAEERTIFVYADKK